VLPLLLAADELSELAELAAELADREALDAEEAAIELMLIDDEPVEDAEAEDEPDDAEERPAVAPATVKPGEKLTFWVFESSTISILY